MSPITGVSMLPLPSIPSRHALSLSLPLSTLLPTLVLATVLATLAGCSALPEANTTNNANMMTNNASPSDASRMTDADDFSALVVLGENGAAVARVLIAAPACPAITIDQNTSAMQLRAAAGTLAQRATASKPEDSKPSAFPLLTCDSAIAPGSTRASVLGRTLPLPQAQVKRIVVIGDTGCRMKKSGNEYQACNDPVQYPFATVAAAAANWKPDLVIHVGDFHYRENACPEDNAGCAGSSWGYGWDAWRDDFFKPAATLLHAAPWVMVRGNHESCTRAGQGYWRFIDPRPLLAGRDCNDAANDLQGSYSDPYAVPLGDSAQLLVIDSAATRWQGFNEQVAQQKYALERYRDNYRTLEQLSRQASYNIGINHQPMLAFGAKREADGQITLHSGDAGLQQAFGSHNPLLLPDGVKLMLSGHVHAWQQLSFSSAHPSQFVAGMSGTFEDVAPLPATLAPGVSPAPGAIVAHFSSWVGGFGFMTLERSGPQQWEVTLRDADGAIKNRCQVIGSQSQCALAQVQ
jgi:hypothetical protein